MGRRRGLGVRLEDPPGADGGRQPRAGEGGDLDAHGDVRPVDVPAALLRARLRARSKAGRVVVVDADVALYPGDVELVLAHERARLLGGAAREAEGERVVVRRVRLVVEVQASG
ncbi:MAG: hypothetical protein JOZ69_22600, partial [Myxococcales bacterium]|nr:hypothetical protein [Myxococcales bacterium]